MLYKRKLLSVVLCIALLFTMMPFSVFASDQKTDVEGYVNCDGSHTFGFQTSAGKVKEDVSTCYYYDKYFTDEEEGNSAVYNPSLSTMSLCLSMAGFARSSGDWTVDVNNPDPRFKFVRDLLIGKIDNQDDVGLGFTDFAVNDVWGASPGRDTIGVVAARKVLSDGSDLVAVVVRGAGYEGEWCSNFTIGKEGNHTGFAKGRDDVLHFVSDYFKNTNLDPKSTKMWVVGYSRGAAVANMVAAEIDKGYKFNDDSIKTENLYAYTFSTPLGGMEEDTNVEIYENIHNVVNYNDMVALIAPTAWNFDRYNSENDVFLPNKENNENFDQLKEKMLSKYSNLKMSNVLPYNVKEEREIRLIKNIDWDEDGNPIIEYDDPIVITHREAASETFDFIADGAFGDRSSYYYIHQKNLRDIIWEIFGSKNVATKEAMVQLFEGLTAEQIIKMGKPLLEHKHISKKAYKEFYGNVENYVNSIVAESGVWSNEEDEDDIITPIVNILFNLLRGVLVDYIFQDGYQLATLVSFVEGIGDKSVIAPHYPEINLSWLMSLDSNYDTPSGDEGDQEKETPSQDIVDSNKKTADPGTGDYDNIYAFVALLCAAGVAMIVATMNRRRDE